MNFIKTYKKSQMLNQMNLTKLKHMTWKLKLRLFDHETRDPDPDTYESTYPETDDSELKADAIDLDELETLEPLASPKEEGRPALAEFDPLDA